MDKPRLSFWAIWTMSFGFFGIQFGWGLQMANMSAIYEVLGARTEMIPILWLAAPLTGLLVQPFIGKWSDRTWGRLGRRRPYFLGGAIVASVMIFLMPYSSSILMAALFLWLLDGSVNVCMGPFRAYVADNLNKDQMTSGYAVQSVLIAMGAILSSALPWILANYFGVSGTVEGAVIPKTVMYAFHMGAGVFILAVLWTVLRGKEYPPEDMEAFRKMQKEKKPVLKEMFKDVLSMPATMRQLAWVQIFAWMGLFCMFMYFPVAVANNIFGAEEGTPLYAQAMEWAGMCFAIYSVVSFFTSMVLPKLCKIIPRKYVYMMTMMSGGGGLASIVFIHTPMALIWSMLGVGIMNAGIMILPYAILGDTLPKEKMGVFMGIFNLFITIPQIIVSLFFGFIMYYLFANDRAMGVMAGGVCMMIASALILRVQDVETVTVKEQQPLAGATN
ncbi:MAG: MFS transporter [Chlamydiota bacterium]